MYWEEILLERWRQDLQKPFLNKSSKYRQKWSKLIFSELWKLTKGLQQFEVQFFKCLFSWNLVEQWALWIFNLLYSIPLSILLSLVTGLLVFGNSRELALCDLPFSCSPAPRPALARGNWVTPSGFCRKARTVDSDTLWAFFPFFSCRWHDFSCGRLILQRTSARIEGQFLIPEIFHLEGMSSFSPFNKCPGFTPLLWWIHHKLSSLTPLPSWRKREHFKFENTIKKHHKLKNCSRWIDKQTKQNWKQTKQSQRSKNCGKFYRLVHLIFLTLFTLRIWEAQNLPARWSQSLSWICDTIVSQLQVWDTRRLLRRSGKVFVHLIKILLLLFLFFIVLSSSCCSLQGVWRASAI